jgi:hypothetical protein
MRKRLLEINNIYNHNQKRIHTVQIIQQNQVKMQNKSKYMEILYCNNTHIIKINKKPGKKI